MFICVRVSACIQPNCDSNCIDQLIEKKLTLLLCQLDIFIPKELPLSNSLYLRIGIKLQPQRSSFLSTYIDILFLHYPILSLYFRMDLTFMCTQMLIATWKTF